jgi:hypothetical protein
MPSTTISGQNGECESPSTMRPNARSLSATQAAGVGHFALVALVWSFGRQMRVSCGNLPSSTNLASSFRKKSARYWSGTDIDQPTYSVGEYSRSDGSTGSQPKITSKPLSRQARKHAVKSGVPFLLGSRQRTSGPQNSP